MHYIHDCEGTGAVTLKALLDAGVPHDAELGLHPLPNPHNSHLCSKCGEDISGPDKPITIWFATLLEREHNCLLSSGYEEGDELDVILCNVCVVGAIGKDVAQKIESCGFDYQSPTLGAFTLPYQKCGRLA